LDRSPEAFARAPGWTPGNSSQPAAGQTETKAAFEVSLGWSKRLSATALLISMLPLKQVYVTEEGETSQSLAHMFGEK
jgi:hypothetical protein